MTRLIDADALMGKSFEIEYADGWHKSVTKEVVSVRDIDNAPTIEPTRDVETVYRGEYYVNWVRPKGKWIRKENNVSWWVECSKCGEKPLLNVYNHTYEKTPYCPYCGADMREE